MSQIATVKSISGTAFVVGLDGQTRPLKAGDQIMKGETIVTSADGRVELDMEGGGQPLAVGPGQTVKVEDSVAEATRPEPQQASTATGTVDSVIQALEQGGDLSQELEATAAGAGGGGGEGGGSGFVRLLRINEGVDPLSYQFGTERPGLIPTPEGEAAFVNDVPTVVVITFPDTELGSPGGVVHESALPGGSGGGTSVTRGIFEITTGSDTLASLVVGGVDVTNGGTVTGQHGTLVVTLIDGIYHWEYTLDQATDGDDTVDNFDVTVTDDDGDSASAAFSINILDDVPDALDDETTQSEENAAVSYNVLPNDVQGADGAKVTRMELTSGAGEITYWDEDGNVTYQPAPGEEGEVTISYTLTDGDGDEDTAVLTIKLLEDSVPEVGWVHAEGGTGVVNEGGLLGGNLGGNTSTGGMLDIATGGDGVASVVINGVDVTQGGTVDGTYGKLLVTVFNGMYQWTYTLDANAAHSETDQTGADDQHSEIPFTVVVTDSDGDEDSADLQIVINDDGPVAVDDVDSTEEDTPVTVDVLANDKAGADGGLALVSAELVVDPQQNPPGTLVVNDDGTLTFTPAPGFEGKVTVNYVVRDAEGDTANAQLVITVGPDSVPEVSWVHAEGGTGVVNEGGLTGGNLGGSISTGGTLGIATGGDNLASVVINTVNVTNGGTVDGTYGKLVVTVVNGVYQWTYTLNDNAAHSGTDQTGADDQYSEIPFTVVVTDSDGDEDSADLQIVINDDGPVALNDTASTPEDTPVTVDVLANDKAGADGGLALVSAELVVDPQQNPPGTLVVNDDGTLTFTPAPGFEGEATVNYVVRDAEGDTANAQLVITVGPDSVPEVSWVHAEGGTGVVHEGGLPGGNLGGSISTSGTLNITTGNDSLATVVIDGVDVTNGGTVDGTYGKLAVTVVDGEYHWTYTLDDNAPHTNPNQTGAGDQHAEPPFTVVVTDSDGSPSSQAVLNVAINDDGPTVEVRPDKLEFTLKLTNYPDNVEAGFNNSFGYYVKNPDGTPKEGVVLWVNVKDKIGVHEVTVKGYMPEEIGFFLIPNGGGVSPALNPALLDPSLVDPEVGGIRVDFVEGGGGWFAQLPGADAPLKGSAGTGSNINTNHPVLFDNSDLNAGDRVHLKDTAVEGNLNWEDLYIGSDEDYDDANIGYEWITNFDPIQTFDTVPGQPNSATSDFSDLFMVAEPSYGADGAAAISPLKVEYSLDFGSAATTTGLTSGGVDVVLSKTAEGVIEGKAGSKLVFTIEVDGAGKVTLTQHAALDHADDKLDNNDSTDNSANLLGLADGTILLSVTGTATDGDGDTATDTKSIDISRAFGFTDAVPTAENHTEPVSVDAQQVFNANVVLTLDRSTSMNGTPMTNQKKAAHELLDALQAKHLDSVGDVKVLLVSFGSNANLTQHSSGWVTIAEAKALIGLPSGGGYQSTSFLPNSSNNEYTNYDAAVARIQSEFVKDGAVEAPGTINLSYFLTDGAPNPTASGLTGTEITSWQTFLNANDIVSYAIGMQSTSSPGNMATYLNPIAYDGVAGENNDASMVWVNVNIANELGKLLVSLVPEPQEAGGPLNGSFGADGGHVQSVEVDGVTYTFDGDTIGIPDTSNATFDSATKELTINTDLGGKLVIDMDDLLYTYTPGDDGSLLDGKSEVVSYTLVDRDGDTASAALTLELSLNIPVQQLQHNLDENA